MLINYNKPHYHVRPAREYVTPSFHSHVLRKLQDNPKPCWLSLSKEEKAALLGLYLIACLDRLQHAEYDVQPVLDCLERLVDTIDGYVNRMYRENDPLYSVVRHLNRLNRRQLDLMDLNIRDDDPELMHLSEEMINRLFMINEMLWASKTDMTEITTRYAELMEALNRTADHLEYLALRHFYANFRRGNSECLAAICLSTGFVRSMAGVFEFLLTGDAFHDFTEMPYELQALLSLGEHFDFRIFDEDANELLPEVADLLFQGDEHNVF